MEGVTKDSKPEPWDTPTPTPPKPQPETPQPTTCPRCNQPTLTFNYRGLTIHLNPQPLNPPQQAAAILTTTSLWTITTTTPHQPPIAKWVDPPLRARRLTGKPTSNLDHPGHPTHTVHRCERKTR